MKKYSAQFYPSLDLWLLFIKTKQQENKIKEMKLRACFEFVSLEYFE
jgi:hypothetical protein